MLKKNRFAQTRSKKQDVSLQITSMADIFTILLVFLLKSYASGEASISPSTAINLPVTKSGKPPIETLHVEIAPDSILVAGKPACRLRGFRFAESEASDLQSLRHALGLQRGRQLTRSGLKASEANDTNIVEKLDRSVTILVDQKVPYQTLKKVMSVAASQGYTDFKLATVKADE